MPKYYVASGSVRRICEAESPRFAALNTVAAHPTKEGLGAQLFLSERGFSTAQSTFDTTEIFNEAMVENE